MHLSAPAPDEVWWLARSVLARANRYTLGTWLPATFPGGGPCIPAGSGEHDVRPLAAAALGLAVEVATGDGSPAAASGATRLLSGLAAAHVANGGTWGGGWQGALWATLTGTAARLVWDELDATTRDGVVGLVAWEADRIAAGSPLFWTSRAGVVLTPGDSRSDDDAWNASILAVAGVVAPRNVNAGAWWAALVEWSIAAHAAPQDVTSDRVVNGARVGDVADGWNVTADGLVVNHAIVHPDYMVAAFASLWSAAALVAAVGGQWPSAGWHNADMVYGALHRHQFPGGPIYAADGSIVYPEGNDWGTSRVMDKAAADVAAWRFGFGGPQARSAAIEHLRAAVAMQERSTTGQTYIDPAEDTYPGREQWVAHYAAWAVLALCTEVRESNADAADVAAANAAAIDPNGAPVTVTLWRPPVYESGWVKNVTDPLTRIDGDVVEVLPGRTCREATAAPLSISGGSLYRFATLPAGHAPSSTTIVPATLHLGGAALVCEVRVNTDGGMFLVPGSAGTFNPGGGSHYLCVPPMRWQVVS